jgi:hypothetical protein
VTRFHRPPTLQVETSTRRSSYHQVDVLTLMAIHNGVLVDFAAVERVINGGTLPLNDTEAYLAARRLAQLGYHATEAGRRTGIPARTIERWKAAGWPAARPDGKRGLRQNRPAG